MNGPDRLAAFMRRKPRKTQEWLAGRLGVDRSYVSNILSGRRTPSLTLAVKIESLTGIPARDFVAAA